MFTPEGEVILMGTNYIGNMLSDNTDVEKV